MRVSELVRCCFQPWPVQPVPQSHGGGVPPNAKPIWPSMRKAAPRGPGGRRTVPKHRRKGSWWAKAGRQCARGLCTIERGAVPVGADERVWCEGLCYLGNGQGRAGYEQSRGVDFRVSCCARLVRGSTECGRKGGRKKTGVSLLIGVERWPCEADG